MIFKRPPIRVWAKQLFALAKRLSVWVMRNTKLLLALVWLLAGVPYLMYELVSALSASSESVFGDVRAILLTLAAWIGAPFLIWRTLLADRQTHINRESHYTDLFTKAIESLGATRLDENGSSIPVIESRIGAIFTLERLAKHSHSDYGTIIETLSAYIREQCGKPSSFDYEGPDPDEEGISGQEQEQRLWAWCRALREWIHELRINPSADRADVAVALTVLMRRREGRHWTAPVEHEVQPSLRGTNLQGWEAGNVPPEFLHDAKVGLSQIRLEGAELPGFYIEGSPILGPQVRHELTGSRVVSKSLVGASILSLTLRNSEFFPILDGVDLSFANMDHAKCGERSF